MLAVLDEDGDKLEEVSMTVDELREQIGQPAAALPGP